MSGIDYLVSLVAGGPAVKQGSDVQPSSDVSPRAARTRAALIAAGFELLAAKPIDAIAIDEVVARAGVSKGSFFNHFADKHAFAAAIAAEVRLELEDEVRCANHGVTDPVERIANGMRVSARFAIRNPKRTVVLLRGSESVTTRSHPLNKGVSQDFDEAGNLGLIRPEAIRGGVLYWLGLCQALMASLLDASDRPVDAEGRLREMMVLGLGGLGLSDSRISEIIKRCGGA
jgi:AcrR family transcriptional regulator